jgi:uncharacterized membrane protein
MILQPGPDAPIVARFAADAALVLHVSGGAGAIASGFVTVAARKGGRLHRRAGNAFFVCMLALSGVAAVVAPLLPEEQWTNTTAAVFALYLTLTGWAAARRRPGELGRFERWAVLAPFGLLFEAAYGAASGRRGFETIYALAVVAALAAVCDLRVIARGGLAGPPRTARHLWRLCAALFIATGSLFLGRQRDFPEALQGTVWLTIPPFAVLGALAFWMLKVRWPVRRRRALAPAA